MKRTNKLFAMLLAVIMVLALVPVVSVAAAEKVVYLGNEAKGDGSAPDKAVGTFADAFAAIGDNDGTIVIVESFEWVEGFEVPEHKGHITITTKYNGTQYPGDIYVVDSSTTGHLQLGGKTTFENITIWLTNTWVIRARYNHLTFGEGIVTKSSNPAHDYPRLYVVGGDNGSDVTSDPTKDTHLTFLSGQFYEVIGGSRNSNVADYPGKCVVEVGSGVDIFKLCAGNRGCRNVSYGSVLCVIDGAKIANWATAHDGWTTGCAGKVEIVLTKNFDISKSFDYANARTTTDNNGDTVFYGLSGASIFENYAEATRLTDAELLVDPAIKDAVMSSGKVLEVGFSAIKDYVYTGTIGSGTLEGSSAPSTPAVPETIAPDTTAAPVVDTTAAPVVDTTAAPAVDTTAAPAQPEPTPATGSNDTVIFAVSLVALVASAAIVFIRRRETN